MLCAGVSTNIAVIVALAICVFAMCTMCLWFVRVSIRQRRREAMMELELGLTEPAFMSEEDFDRLEIIKYQACAVLCGVVFCVHASRACVHAQAQVVQPGVRQQAQNETCTICLIDFEPNDDVRRLPCRHLFHPRKCVCECWWWAVRARALRSNPVCVCVC